MNEATANISWLPFDPRDWEQLTPAFGRLRSMVGAYGSKLIANNRAAAFFDRCVHKERLELALVAPDLTSYRLFDDAERQKLTIRVPLNYEEGCSIEPYHEGHWYVRRSDLEKLTAIPVTPVARAEAELVPARIPPAEPASVPPAESPRVEPGRDVDAADAPVQGTQVKPGGPQLPSAAPERTIAADVGDQAGAVIAATETATAAKRKRRRKKKAQEKIVEAAKKIWPPDGIVPPPPRPPNNAHAIEHVAWAMRFLRITDPGKLVGLRGKKLQKLVCNTVGPNFWCDQRTVLRGKKRADSI